MGFELIMRRAVPCGGIDGVETHSVLNREESITGFLREEMRLELLIECV